MNVDKNVVVNDKDVVNEKKMDFQSIEKTFEDMDHSTDNEDKAAITVVNCPANLFALSFFWHWHCNDDYAVGQPKCNQRSIVTRDVTLGRTPTHEDNIILQMASAENLLGECHAIWYKVLPNEEDGKPPAKDAIPVYSMLPDESIGKHRVIGYATFPDNVQDVINMYDIVSEPGMDDFTSTYGEFNPEGVKLSLSEIISCLACAALQKMRTGKEYLYGTVLQNIARKSGLEDEHKELLQILQTQESVEPETMAIVYSVTKTLIQSYTPMRMGIIDGQHRLFALTCVMGCCMPSANNALKMEPAPLALKLRPGSETPWIWKEITVTTYCSTAFNNFQGFCDWARSKSVQIQSGLAKAIVRTIGNVIVDCVRSSTPRLLFDDNLFSTKNKAAKTRYWTISMLSRPTSNPFWSASIKQ
jgi:hypothetical protein